MSASDLDGPTAPAGPLDPTDPLALARALIRCPSVTPAEGGAIALLAGVLEAAGFEVHRPVFKEAGTPDVENLFARIGAGSGPCLALAGHTDVVPPGDEAAWRHPPFAGVVSDGFLWGRGAEDMKGGVACMLAAALRVLARGALKGSLAILITGDEEGPAVNGTVKLLAYAREKGLAFDACLLTEPTNPEALGDMAKIGRRGSLTGTLAVRGRQGHVAYPHLAANPIPRLMRLLGALLAEPLDGGTAHFGASNLEVTNIEVGNRADNVIPAGASATFNARFNDLWTYDSLRAEIERRLAGVNEGAEVPYDLAFKPSNASAFLTAPGPFTALVADAVEAETGRRPALSTTGGTSDARFLNSMGPVVEFGLVGQTMHQVDERVRVADLETLTRICERVILGVAG